eukprot:GHVT01032858.1.p1 GENE.GHVT01032858.1~~GHVT01032858.1.p1  ORF type:complete len:643 (-),score=77.22 GHVT01032858.1:144-2072(-)
MDMPPDRLTGVQRMALTVFEEKSASLEKARETYLVDRRVELETLRDEVANAIASLDDQLRGLQEERGHTELQVQILQLMICRMLLCEEERSTRVKGVRRRELVLQSISRMSAELRELQGTVASDIQRVVSYQVRKHPPQGKSLLRSMVSGTPSLLATTTGQDPPGALTMKSLHFAAYTDMLDATMLRTPRKPNIRPPSKLALPVLHSKASADDLGFSGEISPVSPGRHASGAAYSIQQTLRDLKVLSRLQQTAREFLEAAKRATQCERITLAQENCGRVTVSPLATSAVANATLPSTWMHSSAVMPESRVPVVQPGAVARGIAATSTAACSGHSEPECGDNAEEMCGNVGDALLLVQLRQAQIEVPSAPVVTDYSEAVLVDADIVESRNVDIRILGNRKLETLQTLRSARRHYSHLEWRLGLLQAEAKDLTESIREVRRLRLTRPLQQILQQLSNDGAPGTVLSNVGATQGVEASQGAVRRTVSPSAISVFPTSGGVKSSIASTSQVGGAMDPREESAKLSLQRRLRTLQAQIRVKTTENATLAARLRDLRSGAAQREHIRKLREGGGGDSSLSGPGSPNAEAGSFASQSFEEVAHRAALVSRAKRQAKVIDDLREELKRYKERTFPSFLHLRKQRRQEEST